MKLGIFLLLYITGVLPSALFRLEALPRNYYLIKTNATWQEAQKYCRKNYTDLASVESADDWVKLQQEAASKGVTQAWLGLYNDIQSWRWTFNDLSLQTTGFMKWYSGEPDNNAGRQWFGVIDNLGLWHDYPYTFTQPFICYNANYSGAAKYIGVTTARNWTAARAYCQQYHTDLASATNSTENSYIQQVASALGTSWFGLYRDTWKWSDGTSVSYLPWSPGTPDNIKGSEDCAILYYGFLADERCTNQYYFFCHKVPPAIQQIVRLQLKGDNSVFVPAVQAAILEQIKKKLAKRNVLQNITVTWRKNPDGSVLRKKTSDDDL